MSHVQCPHCGTTLEHSAEVAGLVCYCPDCKNELQMPPLAPPPAVVSPFPPRYRAPPQTNPLPVIAAIVTLLAAASPIVFMFVCCGGCVNAVNNPSRTSSSYTPSKPVLSTGDIVTLSSGAKKVILATDTDSLSRLTQLSNAGDTEGALGLVLAGRAFLVDSDVQARIIDTGIFSSEVRILEGDQYGKSGWLPVEFIHANPRKTK